MVYGIWYMVHKRKDPIVQTMVSGIPSWALEAECRDPDVYVLSWVPEHSSDFCAEVRLIGRTPWRALSYELPSIAWIL